MTSVHSEAVLAGARSNTRELLPPLSLDLKNSIGVAVDKDLAAIGERSGRRTLVSTLLRGDGSRMYKSIVVPIAPFFYVFWMIGCALLSYGMTVAGENRTQAGAWGLGLSVPLVFHGVCNVRPNVLWLMARRSVEFWLMNGSLIVSLYFLLILFPEDRLAMCLNCISLYASTWFAVNIDCILDLDRSGSMWPRYFVATTSICMWLYLEVGLYLKWFPGARDHTISFSPSGTLGLTHNVTGSNVTVTTIATTTGNATRTGGTASFDIDISFTAYSMFRNRAFELIALLGRSLFLTIRYPLDYLFLHARTYLRIGNEGDKTVLRYAPGPDRDAYIPEEQVAQQMRFMKDRIVELLKEKEEKEERSEA